MHRSRCLVSAGPLTAWRDPFHNSLTCPPATNLHRASHRHTFGGLFRGKLPTIAAYAPDLAGFPGKSPGFRSLQNLLVTLPHDLKVTLLRSHKPNLWRPAMANAINPEAAAALPGDAAAPLAGAAQPPLDLSLGHFGTTEGEPNEESGVQVLAYEHLRLVVDFDHLSVTLLKAQRSGIDRQTRRRTEREVRKQIQKLRGHGFDVVEGGAL